MRATIRKAATGLKPFATPEGNIAYEQARMVLECRKLYADMIKPEQFIDASLESGEETIYALDTLSGQTQEQQTHVLLDDGTALAQTVCTPRVCGVAVVCEGGGDVRIAARITELVGALLDVPSNRICVEQRRE